MCGPARLNFAVALATAGRIPEARARAEEALRIDPSYARARQFLAANQPEIAIRPVRSALTC